MNDITIHLDVSEDPFARIRKDLLEDTELSWRAKGIICYLLGKHSDWKVRAVDIERRGKEGMAAVRTALRELRELGYAQLQEVREDGRIVEYRMVVADRKIFPKNDTEAVVVQRSVPCTKNPLTVNPHAGNPHTEIRSRTKNHDTENDDTENKTPAEPVLALERPKARVAVARRPDTLIDVEVIPRKPKAVPEVPLVLPAVLAASPEFVAKWEKWVAVRRGMKKVKDWSGLFQEQLQFLSGYSPEVATQILSNSIMGGWQGLFPPKNGHANGGNGKVPAWQERKEWQEQLKRAEDEIKTLMSGDSHADLDFVDRETLKRARAVRDEMRKNLGYKI